MVNKETKQAVTVIPAEGPSFLLAFGKWTCKSNPFVNEDNVVDESPSSSYISIQDCFLISARPSHDELALIHAKAVFTDSFITSPNWPVKVI